MLVGPNVSILSLLVFLLGGSNDLLDYVPTDAYWQAKHVEISRESMAAELTPTKSQDASKLIEDLSNPDPQTRKTAADKLAAMGPSVVPQLRAAADAGDPETSTAATDLINRINLASKASSVRRLMAIRALGESKDPKAMGVLKPLLESKEPFEPDYAAAAVALIEGRPSSRPVAPLAARSADAWSLPDTCAAVVQLSARASHPVSLDTFAVQMMATGMRNGNKQQIMNELNAQLMEAADKFGNVRLDMMTIGISGLVGPNSGHVVFVVRGTFDAKAVAAELQKQHIPSKAVGGVDVYELDQTARFFMPGDGRIVLVGGAQGVLPLEAIVGAIAAGKNDLHASKDLSPLLAAADTTLPVWGVAKVTASYRQSPELAPFDVLTLTGQPAGDNLNLNLAATGSDPNGASAAVANANNGLQQMLGEVRPGVAMFPALRPAIAALDTIKITSAGGNATVTATMPRSLADAMLNPAAAAANPPATQPATPETQPN